MAAFYGITPLAPAYILLSGAVLVLLLGPPTATISRHWLRVVVCGVALIALALVDIGALSGGPRAPELHTLILWPDSPAIALQNTPFQPLRWGLFLSLLALVLAGREFSARFLLGGQALVLVLGAAAFAVLSSATGRTLAVTLVLFDSLTALWWAFQRQPDRAAGRLVLAVVTGAGIMTLTAGLDSDRLGLGGLQPDVLFSVAVWLRIGLYPLLETGTPAGAVPPLRQAWVMLNLVVGLHLASIATVPDIAWPAQITALLHGGLAWVEPRREKAMAHAAWALAGNTLVAAALGVNSLAVAAGAANVVAGWLVLALTPAAGSRPIPAAPQRPLATPGGGTLQWLLPYVSLGLVTVAWFGLPFTTGWLGRGALLQTMWDTRGPQMLALAVVSSGAALSVLYRAWQTMLRRSSREQWPALERPVGALIAATPFLVPGLGMWFVSLAGGGTWNPASLDFYGVGAWIGLGGMLLWTVFLGYSRDWLAWLSPDQRQRMLAWLRLGWLVRRADWLAQTSGRVLLRIRSILEGEHYLAWALLTALCIALLLLFNPLASGR